MNSLLKVRRWDSAIEQRGCDDCARNLPAISYQYCTLADSILNQLVAQRTEASALLTSIS